MDYNCSDQLTMEFMMIFCHLTYLKTRKDPPRLHSGSDDLSSFVWLLFGLGDHDDDTSRSSRRGRCFGPFERTDIREQVTARLHGLTSRTHFIITSARIDDERTLLKQRIRLPGNHIHALARRHTKEVPGRKKQKSDLN